MKRKIF